MIVMTLDEALRTLEAAGDEKRRAHNKKYGASDNQFGVPMGGIRALAKKIKTDHGLARALWKTGNVDAQLLAVLVLEPKKLTADEVDAMVRSITFSHVADWMSSYVIKPHPEKEALRQRWMADGDPMAARAGWALTAEHVETSPGSLDLDSLLDRIESEMGRAHPHTQWTMNAALAQIGIHHPSHRKRALAIGERLGLYRDYPVSKGCTSPFAPAWINEMVKRKG